jgi:hypothetical protein
MQPVFIARSVVVAVMGTALEPTPVPDWLRDKLEHHGGGALPAPAEGPCIEGSR